LNFSAEPAATGSSLVFPQANPTLEGVGTDGTRVEHCNPPVGDIDAGEPASSDA
jgi:hypothetical protein